MRISKQPIKVDRNNNLAADANCKLMRNRILVRCFILDQLLLHLEYLLCRTSQLFTSRWDFQDLSYLNS